MLKQHQNITKYNILILCQLQDTDSQILVRDTRDILSQCPQIKIFTEDAQLFDGTDLYEWIKQSEIIIHYTICIGSNQTLIWAIQKIINNPRILSPIVSISNGTQPILSSYSFCDLEKVIRKFIQTILLKKIKYKQIMTMDVISQKNRQILKSFTGQLQINRGVKQGVVKLNIYVRAEEKDFMILAPLWGDGIIVSTPFGSTGKSMALNGPIVHKNLECIMIVPVCPLSLNFRPIILPACTQILIEVDKTSRAPAKIFSDGQQIDDLAQGQRIIVRKGNKKVKIVFGLTQISSSESWIMNLHNVISWAEHFGAKSPPQTISTEKIIIKQQEQIK